MSERELSVPEVVRRAREAVVHVEVDRGLMGSGFWISDPASESPCVVTNAHVVDESSRICVRLYDDREVEARVRFVERTLDLAVLDVEENPLGILPLRGLCNVLIGEQVVAIGSAYGMEGTVTTGIVSGIDRSAEIFGCRIENLIVTDALIGSGNSGGPLVAVRDGHVLGVNTAELLDVTRDPSGFGYALPSSAVQIALTDHHDHGQVRRGTLGLRTEMRELTAAERDRWQAPSGLVVTADPEPDTAGHAAGVRRGDLLIRLDDFPVHYAGDVFALLDHTRIGCTCELLVVRAGERVPLTITPAPRGD